MDIAGTKQKIQRVVKVAEETYKKINQVIEQVEQLQEDLEQTSQQVDYIEREQADQRALLEALAEEQGLDVEAILDDVEYPERLQETDDDGDSTDAVASSRPSQSAEE
jgi:DNA-binding transcriptional regulator GbsR (MarR family)